MCVCVASACVHREATTGAWPGLAAAVPADPHAPFRFRFFLCFVCPPHSPPSLHPPSHPPHSLAGRAAYYSGDTEAAASHFRAAVAADTASLPALEGVALVEAATGDHAGAARTYEELVSVCVGGVRRKIAAVERARNAKPSTNPHPPRPTTTKTHSQTRLARAASNDAKEREYLWRTAEARNRAGDLPAAETALRALLSARVTRGQRLEALTFLADVQAKLDAASQDARMAELRASDASTGGLTRSSSRLRLVADAEAAAAAVSTDGGYGDTLRAVVALTRPCPRYAKYHEAHLQRYLSALGAHAPRSAARADARALALAECVRMVVAPGGCATAFPFEAAIWLLEEAEEIGGGHGPPPIPAASLRRVRTTLAGSTAASGAGTAVTSPVYSGLGPRTAVGSPPSGGALSPRASMGAWRSESLLSPRGSLVTAVGGGGGGGGGEPASPRAAPASLARISVAGLSRTSTLVSPRDAGAVATRPRTPPAPTGPAAAGACNLPARTVMLPRRPSQAVLAGSAGVTPTASAAAASTTTTILASSPSAPTAYVFTRAAAPAPSADATVAAARARIAAGAAAPVQLGWFRGNSIVLSDERRLVGQLVKPGTGRTSDRGSAGDLAAGRAPAATDDADDDDDDDPGPSASVVRIEQFGMKLAHQFPWAPAAAVAVGLALRRRFLSDPDAPSTLTRRRQITATLRRGVLAGADSAAGWKALAELQYQSRDYAAARDSATAGLQWSARRRAAGHETLTSFALSLRLCLARCLRRLGAFEEAEAAFKILAGWVSEGECAFDELCGSPPMQIRQQALRGLAKLALARGDRDGAKSIYERILGKALIGRGAPAEHWAHAEYAWLAFEGGDLETGRAELERALATARTAGCAVTDSEIAEHEYRLGRILWTMGGACRDDRVEGALPHFEAAAAEESDCQADAAAWAGHWYREVGLDPVRAAHCYEASLELRPDDTCVARALESVRHAAAAAKRAGSAASLRAIGGGRDSDDDATAAAQAAADAARAAGGRRAAFNSALASTWSASFAVRHK